MLGELLEAVANGDVAKVKELVAEGADINGVNEQGMSPAFVAAAVESLAMLALLKELGADMEQRLPVQIRDLRQVGEDLRLTLGLS